MTETDTRQGPSEGSDRADRADRSEGAEGAEGAGGPGRGPDGHAEDRSEDRSDRIDRYQDGLPRLTGRAEDFGPLTLFVRQDDGSPLHARPTRGWTGRPVTAADVDGVRARQRALGVPENFEWVDEAAPALRAAAEESGLAVESRPLLVLPEPPPPAPPTPVPPGVVVLTATPDATWLASAVGGAHLSFAELGTQVGRTGTEELARALDRYAPETARLSARIEADSTAMIAAVKDGVALSSGLLPAVVHGVTEICAIATLPAARRQGLALAVTAALVKEAHARGAETVYLCATDDAVARVYARLGFRRTATFMEAAG